jgi:hypothetical protein
VFRDYTSARAAEGEDLDACKFRTTAVSWFSLHDVFSRSAGLGYFSVLQAFGNELDDSVFTFTWDTFP